MGPQQPSSPKVFNQKEKKSVYSSDISFGFCLHWPRVERRAEHYTDALHCPFSFDWAMKIVAKKHRRFLPVMCAQQTLVLIGVNKPDAISS